MRRNFDPLDLFDVPQPRGENIVMSHQSKEISENVEQLIGVILNNERFPKGLVRKNLQIVRLKERSSHILGLPSPPLVRGNVISAKSPFDCLDAAAGDVKGDVPPENYSRLNNGSVTYPDPFYLSVVSVRVASMLCDSSRGHRNRFDRDITAKSDHRALNRDGW